MAAAAANDGETVITGAERLKIKESDRLTSVYESLKALGVDISKTDDGLVINKTGIVGGGAVSGYNDHRMVMCFGQSHSEAIGCVIDGLPAGVKLDTLSIEKFMERRAPGRNKYSTTRREADKPVILSGLVDNTTCGAPLAMIIENTNTRSGDYGNIRTLPRPGHSDYAAAVKYNSFNDIAGGGHFSGRLTAPLCFAGSVCMQILKLKGIDIKAHIAAIGGIEDEKFDPVSITDENIAEKEFPVINDAAGDKMKAEIEKARLDADSVGGIIECAVTGVKAGFGEPMFEGIENRLAAAVFGIPAVKGIEFGRGFSSALLRGSENNDEFIVSDGTVRTETNNHGGILGGITSGMPIVFRVAIKPTPSIGKPQRSVNLETMEEEELLIKGRHDPCIVPRAVPAVEAVTAVTMLDIVL